MKDMFFSFSTSASAMSAKHQSVEINTCNRTQSISTVSFSHLAESTLRETKKTFYHIIISRTLKKAKNPQEIIEGIDW